VRRAGFGEFPESGDRLFDAILNSPSGVVFTIDEHDDSWKRVGTADGRINLALPELLGELAAMVGEVPPGDDPEWPLMLSAGERRSFTANTIMRDPLWRKKDEAGALRVSPHDAARIGLADGETGRITTKRGSTRVVVAIDEGMQPGHVSLPNGLGLDHVDDAGRVITGVAPNELTASEDRDPWAGTPWHKTVPARLETIA
jgi:anaerobic selenocysteine-containing dehydrogenase